MKNLKKSGKCMTIRQCTVKDRKAILDIINDAAQAYRGVIPEDRWHEPYMSSSELDREIAEGVQFWAMTDGKGLLGVMGIQDRGAVCLIRHAYVRTSLRQKGVGTALLAHLDTMTAKPILIGTWDAASWAIRFYVKNGYRLLPADERARLLHTFWDVPERQIETSVVLADSRWFQQ